MDQDKAEIFAKVKDILSTRLNTRFDEMTLDDSLVDDLGADSLDLVELVLYLEETYGIAIDEKDAEALETVGDVVAFLQSNKAI